MYRPRNEADELLIYIECKISYTTYNLYYFVLQRVCPLLANDLEIDNERTSAARQQILNKQVYAAVIEQRFGKQTRSHGNDLSTTMNGVLYAVHIEIL
jgi:hypothetical protein